MTRVILCLIVWVWLAPLGAQSIRHLASLGPGGGGGVFAAVFHNADPDIILISQDVGGVYKTTDGGKTWHHVNNRGLIRPELREDGTFVDTLVADPSNENRFFACTQSGLFRSDDVGESWSMVIPPAGASMPELPVSWVAFSPLDPTLGLAGTGSWHEPDRGFGLYRTTDGGLSFALVTGTGIPDLATISSIVFDPDDGTVYASTTSGLYLSSDGGLTFTKSGFAFRHDQGQWVGIGGTGSSKTFWYVLYTLGNDGDPASRSGGIYRSPDGATWTEITGEPTVNDTESNELLRAMGAQVDPGDPQVLYLNLRTDGGQGGLYRWEGSWTEVTATFMDDTWSAGFSFSPIAPECVSVNRDDPNLIISCNEKALLISRDRGATWSQLSMRRVAAAPARWRGTGAEVVDVYDLAGSGDTLYAAFEDIGFWRSDDRGASWFQLLWPGAMPDTIRPDGATAIALHPSDINRFYVFLGSFSNAIREGDVRPEIQKSLDGGQTFVDVTPPAPAGPLGRGAMAVFWGPTPAQDILYAAFHGDTLYRSRDGGASWTEISTGFTADDKLLVFRIAVDPSDSSRVWAGLNSSFGTFKGQGGIYASTNGGDSWSRLAGYPERDVFWLRFAGSPSRLFAGGATDGDGALRVSDDGVAFTAVLSQPFVTVVADAPGEPGTLYAVSSSQFVTGNGQNAGIYRSTDNGDTWARLEGNPEHTKSWDILVLPDQPDVLYLASDGDGILAMRVDDRKRHFAQFGDGGGISSTLVLVNPNSSAASGTVRLFDSSGNPLTVDINGTTQNGMFPFNLPAEGVAFFASGNTGATAQVGSVEVEGDASLGGTILFSSTGGVAGVGAVQPSSTRFVLPVENNTASGVRTGVALSNQTAADQTATLTLRRPDGSAVANGSTSLTLASRNQNPQFVDEIFKSSGIDFSSFQGTLEVETASPITGMAIRTTPPPAPGKPGQFATLPVVPLGFGQRMLHFAHFGDGGGISSTLILVNPSSTQSAAGTVRIFDDSGAPFAVDINGMVQASGSFTFNLAPLGAAFFATDGAGTLATGAVEVESDAFLDGTILFGGDFGVAGVGAVEPATGFLVPIDSNASSGVDTGVAMANPQAFPVQVKLRLLDAQGKLVAGGEITKTLAGHGHVAQFPFQLFAGSGIDFSSFRGTLEVTAPVPIAGMAIRTSPGEFATLPVTALP